MPPLRIVILDSFAADQGDVVDVERACARWASWWCTRAAPTRTCVARCAGATAALTNKVPFAAADASRRCRELRYVGVLATGTNVVDLAAARAAGVAVTNVPGYAAESVARAGVRAGPAVLRTTSPATTPAVKAGAWAALARLLFLHAGRWSSWRARRWSIVGSGAIGGAVARIGEAFGMRVIRAAVPGSPGSRRRVAHAARRGAAASPTWCRSTARSPTRRVAWSTRGFLAAHEAGRDPRSTRGAARWSTRLRCWPRWPAAGWAASGSTCCPSSRRPPIIR